MKNNASEIQDLRGQAAIEKFKEIVKHEQTCLFSTNLGNVPQTTRPMGIQKVCDQGNFWFMSASDSDKNQEIKVDSRVQLYICNTKNYEFLSVYGHATISRDQDKIDEFWSDIHKAWFPEGKDDPRITIVKVTPDEGVYWDTKDGKLVSLLKIVASAVTGKTLKEGVEGNISVK